MLPLRSVCSVAVMLVGSLLASWAEADDNWAAKMFSTQKFNFGSVAQHSDCQGELKFTNPYKPDMEVVSVSTSCRCIKATTESKVVKQGQAGAIQLVLDTSRFQGQRNVTLTVRFRYDGKNVAVNIPCEAFIRTDVWMQPGIASFGSVSTGEEAVKTVKVTRTGNDNWKIREVRSHHAALSTEFRELSRSNGRVEYEVAIKVAGNAPVGSLQDSLVLVTNDSSNANVALRVEGKVDSDFLITPEKLPLGTLHPGQTREVTVIVKGKKPFQIQSVSAADHPDCFHCAIPSGEKPMHILKVAVTPPSQMGPLTEKFSIQIAGRSVPVTFEANGQVESVITASDSTP
ncbi:MAG: DUF1573 domain-containing protein [Planctomycetota bacterium]|nr:MAG: DUF1573 domain-containing protein [Planctomycetota bacterium]